MSLPPRDADSVFEEIIQGLSEKEREKAREFKVFARGRKIRTVEQLLRVVRLYCGLDQSAREVAGVMGMLYEPITEQSILERLRGCGPWLKAMVMEVVKVEAGVSWNGRRMSVVDATTVNGPGAKGSENRIHVRMELVSLEFLEIHVTDHKTGETLKNFRFEKGEVVIADRGYSQAEGILKVKEEGAEVVVRLNPQSLPVYHEAGEKIDLAAVLKEQERETVHTIKVEIRDRKGERKEVAYVHAYRLGAKAAEQARRKCRKRSSKRKSTVAELTLLLAEFVLIITTLPPEELSAEAVLKLYRCRWQVELAFKKWKSVLNVDALRAKQGSALAQVWLYGKLLYALLVNRRMQHQFGEINDDLDQERTATWWRAMALAAEVMRPLITGVEFWPRKASADQVHVLAERPRRRKLQTLPDEVIAFLTPGVSFQSKASAL